MDTLAPLVRDTTQRTLQQWRRRSLVADPRRELQVVGGLSREGRQEEPQPPGRGTSSMLQSQQPPQDHLICKPRGALSERAPNPTIPRRVICYVESSWRDVQRQLDR